MSSRARGRRSGTPALGAHEAQGAQGARGLQGARREPATCWLISLAQVRDSRWRSRHRSRSAVTMAAGPERSYVVQVVPLTVKLIGAASLVVQVPWKPSEVLEPGAIVAL
jgi:hypothetical protein